MIDLLASNPYSCFSVGFVLLSSLYTYSKDRAANPHRLPTPPGPKGYPLIGNLLQAPSSKPWLTYEKWFKVYGDMVYFKILGRSFLILGSLEKTADFFEKRSSNYSDRPTTIMLSDIMGWHYNWALLPYGTWWRRHRRAFHQYFHPNRVSTYHPIQLKCIRGYLRRLLSDPEDFLSHTHHLFAELITEIAYGIKIKEHKDPYVERIKESLGAISEATIPGKYLVEMFPMMKYIPSWFPGAGWKRRGEYFKGLNELVAREPFETVRNNLKNGTAFPSMAASLIEGLPEEGAPERDEEERIAISISATAFIGGADTTVSTTQSFILAMCLHPEVQKKAQLELDMVLEGKRLPDLNDRPFLPYINAMVKEAIRWHPVLPLAVPHMSTDDDEYEGYFIPKGTVVVGNAWAILHDPDVYEDPARFMPERFLKDGNLDPAVRDPLVAAFGFGRRLCPGIDMSDTSIFLTIASVLSVFDIQTPLDEDGIPIQIKPDYTNGNFQFPLPYKAVIKPRSRAAAMSVRDLEIAE
ncbi:cytochrome P450 [Macrolepiota fuliginosa MF-IS2]|uniref:Cytochrome P450 n=1 Tax=Macrolepiota fuliginosa MF-IS2 TaxID=1400762 RepID=A0A9P6BVQ3_9AGAR|nr:cytochrome P450 [Macrolepiota fuliginosa MF-IS2]